MRTNHHAIILSLAVVLVCIDEVLKHWALNHLPTEGEALASSILQFAVHQNFGIAFNIPFKQWVILTITCVLGIVLLRIAYNEYKRRPAISAAAVLIMIGAAGNVFDRIVYGFTVDYIILFSRSAINFSDLLIISGVVWLLLASRQKKHRS